MSDHVLSTYVAVRVLVMRAGNRLRADERGEGVISAAIAKCSNDTL